MRRFPDFDQGKWQVSRAGGEEPAWSRDGNTLYYVGPDSMMAVAVQGTAGFTHTSPSPLFSRSGYMFAGPARSYDIAPDGRFLMLKPAAREGARESAAPAHLILVEHWFEELKRLVPTN